MKAILLFSVAIFAGCNAPVQMPNQDRAASIVWNLYGQKEPLPQINWWTTTCPIDVGVGLTAVYIDGKCYSGLTYGYWDSEVAWRGSFSLSAFAHELMHAAQAHRGIIDSEHKVTADWEVVDKANELLRSEGL